MAPTELIDAVSGREAVWKPLVDAPPPAVAKPDLAKMLTGVTVTRDKMGAPPNMKVRMKTPQDRRGGWMQAGDTVNGLVIKEITLDAVVFQLVKDGKTYEHSVRRPQR
ncbi:MAG: hypothetical protein GY851_33880 [bacterium]|nr:hypothetical protein [bacterium]